MISAAEAREISSVKEKSIIDKQMTMVEVKIKEAVNRGDSNCYIDFPLHREVIRQMKEQGYSISSGGIYNDIEYQIRW